MRTFLGNEVVQVDGIALVEQCAGAGKRRTGGVVRHRQPGGLQLSDHIGRLILKADRAGFAA
jgi:hypothetical protein